MVVGWLIPIAIFKFTQDTCKPFTTRGLCVLLYVTLPLSPEICCGPKNAIWNMAAFKKNPMQGFAKISLTLETVYWEIIYFYWLFEMFKSSSILCLLDRASLW